MIDMDGALVSWGDEVTVYDNNGTIIVDGRIVSLDRQSNRVSVEDSSGITWDAHAYNVRRVSHAPIVYNGPVGHGTINGSQWTSNDTASMVHPYDDRPAYMKQSAPARLLCREHTPAASFGKRSWCTTCDVNLEFVDFEWRVK